MCTGATSLCLTASRKPHCRILCCRMFRETDSDFTHVTAPWLSQCRKGVGCATCEASKSSNKLRKPITILCPSLIALISDSQTLGLIRRSRMHRQSRGPPMYVTREPRRDFTSSSRTYCPGFGCDASWGPQLPSVCTSNRSKGFIGGTPSSLGGQATMPLMHPCGSHV